ncbi:MAG TPA: glycosyltransferase [Egibacteraceae bacterium]|nr:glycosyltransferase [Egibacteraceae bacterium]
MSSLIETERQVATTSVSIIVVNLNGEEFLGECLLSLARLNYPSDSIEIIVVDNGSTDSSVKIIRETAPNATVIRNRDNKGFAPAVNQAVERASGEFLALLNNDAAADPQWIAAAADVLAEQPDVACVASKILRTDGTTIDFAGGEMAFYGHGFAAENEEPDRGEDTVRPTLFASGGAMIVRRRVWEETGGFDPAYFAFFEDVDFGWRLWILGYQVWFVPASRVLHRHHGTIKRFGDARERYLLERNALRTIVKNYGDEALAKTLPAALALAVSRGLGLAPGAIPSFALEGASAPEVGDVALPGTAVAHLAAIRDWSAELHEALLLRRDIQARRRVADREIFPLFSRALTANSADWHFQQSFHAFLEDFGIRDLIARDRAILIITADRLGERMAGPAIRAWEMAKLLSRHVRVHLATTQPTELRGEGFEVVHLPPGSSAADLLAGCDAVVVQGFVLHLFPEIAESAIPVIVDIYDPFHLEALESRKDASQLRRIAEASSDLEVLSSQLRRGDFFLCASERQREYWLGHLTALGRVNAETHADDASLRRLIEVAPFGLPASPPQQTERRIRGVIPGIGGGDFVVLWGGGIYDWFDPLSVIRAVDHVAAQRPDVRLVFFGAGHPNPDVPAMSMAVRARQLSDDLGLTGKHVFFLDEWVAYDQRGEYLLDADVGVSAAMDSLETTLSFRTRVLDYIWAGLPMVTTRGDTLSDLIQRKEAGVVVDVGDDAALAAALLRLRDESSFREQLAANCQSLRAGFAWERALDPLVRFALSPRRAPDAWRLAQSISEPSRIRPGSLRAYAGRFRQVLKEEGPRVAVTRTAEVVRRRRGR